jgi:hypothetical protein
VINSRKGSVGRERAYKVWSEKLNWRGHEEDISVYVRVIIYWILEKRSEKLGSP